MESIYKDLKDGAARQRISAWCERQLKDLDGSYTRQVWDTIAGPTHLLFSGPQTADHTIVYVPGTNFCAAACLPEIAVLSQHHRVISLDVPGEPGLSSGRRVRDARLNQLGVWLEQILQRLNQPATLVGHSLGAAVVMSAESPHITSRIMLSPAGIRRLRTPPALLWSSLAWLVRPSERTSRDLLVRMCAPGQTPRAEQIEWLTLVGRWVRTGLDPGVLPDPVLRQVRARAHVVATGTYDVFAPPDHLNARVEEMLDSTVVPLQCGHLLNHAALRYINAAAGHSKTPYGLN